MIYIYDILLNFNEDFYEFYEWEKGDYLYHIKKIPIFKVETSFMELLFSKKIKLEEGFVKSLSSKVELFGTKKNKSLNHSCLFTDGYKVIGVMINDSFEISQISDLLLDEATDAINISSRCNMLSLEYTIIGSRKNNFFLTRKEKKIKLYLEEELKKIHKNKENSKLAYLYFEYFNKEMDDIELAYKELYHTLKTVITEKHEKLYELLHLKEEGEDNKQNLKNLTKG